MSICRDFKFPLLIKYFEEISAIPRASYKEQKIADYLCRFAEEHGLEYYRDAAHNVLINAPASSGCESVPALLLQGHTDMVCEKNADVVHDFDKQGVYLYEDNGWLRARGTTLGADNGVAVAVMLCVLGGGVERHGALQCLFTSAEEVGLDGVKSFDYSKIYARRMINMDSAEECEIIAGCAGGQRTSVTFEPSREFVSASSIATVSVSGLFGGHSGEDIHRGRANANKLMGKILDEIFEMCEGLVSILGGTKDNAIPRECVAKLACCDQAALKDKLCALGKKYSCGLCDDDKGFSLSVTFERGGEVECIDRKTAQAIIFMMQTVKNGIFAMNHGMDNVVEFSRNLGIAACCADSCELVFSSRSSFEERIDISERELDAYAKVLGAHTRHYNRYPGWSFAQNSPLRDAYSRAFEELFAHRPKVNVIHAGLECGFISRAVPDMDIISCGPNVVDLHSPDERMEIASFERFFEVIKRVIEDK